MINNVEEWRRGPGPNCQTERTGFIPPLPPFIPGIKEAIWERVADPTLNRKGGSCSLCLTVGTGPSSPFLDICHMMVHYHVTNFTDED